MKIGIFTDCYLPQINGVVTSIMMLEQELISRGHEVTIITVQVPDHEDTRDNIIRVNSFDMARIQPKLKQFRLGYPAGRKLIKDIKALNLDLVHTHTEFTMGLLGKKIAKILDIPCVHTYHTMYEDYSHYVVGFNFAQSFVKKAIRNILKIYMRQYNCIIAPSDKTRLSLRGYGITNQIHTLPTGIDCERFRIDHMDPAEITKLRHQWGIKDTDYVMLSLGRVAKEKNIELIIKQMPKIVERIPNAKLLVVGDGSHRAKLQAMASALNMEENIIFPGAVPYSEVPDWYHLADLFVNASFTETQGLTILEAMTSSLPIVVYDDTNIKDLVVEGITGRLFKTEEDLFKQIIDAHNDSLKTDQIIINALDTANQMSKENYAKNAETIYQSMLQENYHTLRGIS